MKTLITILLTVVSLSFAQAETAKKAAAPKAAKAAKSAPAKADHHAAAAAPKGPYTRKYGMAGCGLGTYVMGKNGSQILAATTNGTSGNQTFGITFGTLNCDDADRMQEVAARMDHFVVGNKVALASDIARGNGEALQSLAKIMNCTDQATLSSTLQGNFRTVFPNSEIAPNEITDNIITVIIQNPSLASQCKISG